MLEGHDYSLFLQQLRNHEGERLSAYKDTVGILTIGVGHNCVTSPVPGVSKVGDTISQSMSTQLFMQDVEKHTKEVDAKLPWISKLDSVRQAVVYNLHYNMGMTKLLTFKNTLKFIEDGDYEQAAKNMLMSKWAKQVKGRAIKLAKQMETGVWQL